MTTKRRDISRPHRKKLSTDPLVTIDGARVRAAIEVYGDLSISAASRRLRVPQQTLNSIVGGQVKRCRASLRNRIGRLIGLNPYLLAPEGEYPQAAEFALYVEPHLGSDHRWYHPPRLPMPPRGEFAAARLHRVIFEAWLRDLRRGDAPPPPYPADWVKRSDAKYAQTPEDRDELMLLDYARLVATHVMSPWRWRTMILAPDSIGPWVSAADFDAFTVGWGRGIEALLRPWFEDSAKLNYEALYALIERVNLAPSLEQLVGHQPTEGRREMAREHARSTGRLPPVPPPPEPDWETIMGQYRMAPEGTVNGGASAKPRTRGSKRRKSSHAKPADRCAR